MASFLMFFYLMEKTMLGFLKEKALVMVLVALALTGGYIFFDAFSDRGKEISRLNTAVTEKDREIVNLGDKLKKAEDLNNGKEKIADNKKEVQEKVDAGVSDAKKYVDKRMKEIDTKYEKLPKTDENKEARRIEISLDRVRGLWLIYCIQVPQDLQCK